MADEITHFAEWTKSQEYLVLYRADSGMRVATCHNQAVIFGINPNKAESRAFHSFENAKLWMIGQVANDDWALQGGTGKAVVYIREMEHAVVLPADSIEFDLNPHKRKFN